ncbi:MAG TPA: aminomethyltransferase family protein [Usitatibacter sp.]|nr:aminomethyltransferase family protein [Usitatibacter sp.]
MSSAEEHLAVREGVGLFDFSFMGHYEFDDAEALQALQSRDLTGLEIGQIAYTLLLAPNGAVRIDATVWRRGPRRYWLFAGKRAAYGGRDRSGELAILALQGPASGTVLARLIGRDAVAALRYFRFTEVQEIIVARIGYCGELGYELLVPADEVNALRRRLLEAGRVEGLRECGWAAADSLRIEAGYVLFDREVDGEANPRELGLERLVDGGTRFALRRRLAGLEILEGRPGAELPPAAITSECLSPTLGKALALGFVAPEAVIGSEVRAGDRRARVAELPFYDRERLRPRAAPLPG